MQVGAPPEVSARLTAMAQELEARQRTALGGLGAATEPELDQFMVSYPSASNKQCLQRKDASVFALQGLYISLTEAYVSLLSTRF